MSFKLLFKTGQIFKLGKKAVVAEGPPVVVFDPTGYILDNSYAQFVIQHSFQIQFACLLAYAFVHGVKVFKSVNPKASPVFKLLSLTLACTGGGILVPIFLNSIPVPLASDVYIVAILISFALHSRFPILRELFSKNIALQLILIVLYETTRAGVVCKFTKKAGETILASWLPYPLFGPIMCGTVSGCGGAFMPLSKGLEPTRAGMPKPAKTALIGAAAYHLFVNTKLTDGVIDAPQKGQVLVASFFISVSLVDLLMPLLLKKVEAKKKAD